MDRLFLSLELPPAAQEALIAAQTDLRARWMGADVDWAPPDELHFTLHFLGDVDDVVRDALIRRLQAESRGGAIDLRLTGAGAFPGHERPRVLWVGTSRPPALDDLHRRLTGLLVASGIALDPRPFVPHVTLGRIRGGTRPFAPSEIRVSPVAFAADRLLLMRSRANGVGPRYETVAVFPLVN